VTRTVRPKVRRRCLGFLGGGGGAEEEEEEEVEETELMVEVPTGRGCSWEVMGGLDVAVSLTTSAVTRRLAEN
jgi:hypothetical protein